MYYIRDGILVLAFTALFLIVRNLSWIEWRRHGRGHDLRVSEYALYAAVGTILLSVFWLVYGVAGVIRTDEWLTWLAGNV